MEKFFTLFLLCIALTITAQDVTTFAGSALTGYVDGSLFEARFNNVEQIAVDSEGNVYVADSDNNVIRKISTDDQVTTYAGTGDFGDVDGESSVAQFAFPLGIAIDQNNGNIYVGDNNNNKVRLITPDGQVSTYAGSGEPVAADGPAAEASFDHPVYLCVDHLGNVYVAESNSSKIRKIDAVTRDVSTVAGTGEVGFANGAASAATFNLPRGIAVDENLNLYVADQGNNAIRKISADGQVSTYAGNIAEGHNDGNGLEARFNGPKGLTIDEFGNLYVADRLNYCVRKINANVVVSTVVGLPGFSGYQDGDLGFALIGRAVDVGMLTRECLLISDWQNDCIRKVLLSEAVPTKEISINDQFSIFPNPAQDFIQVEGEMGDNYQLQLFNEFGKLLFTQDNQQIINISELAAGIYFVKIEGTDFHGVAKFNKIGY